MKQRSVLFILIVSLAGFLGMAASYGCANIAPPEGGKRDTLPPVLMRSVPVDSTKSFAGKKITFTFNEFVQLDQIQDNLVVSPYPKILPTVDGRLREVTITLRDTLEENTTYVLNFGNAIKDVNEGNVLKNFRYIFSTGPHIDSFSITGKVIMAETGKADSTMVVVLHKNLSDTAIIKERPRYVTKLDGRGNFSFRNIPPGEYAVFALKDEGGMKRYTSPTQLFAFNNTTVNSQPQPEPLTLYAFEGKDTAAPRPQPVLPKQPPTRAQAAADKRLRPEPGYTNGVLGLLDTLHIRFNQAPLRKFDSSKIVLTNEKFERVPGYSLVEDSTRKKITFLNKWIPGASYAIIVEKDFAEDSAGRVLIRKDTFEFRVKKESDYGLIRLRIPSLDLSKNPVLQLVQNDKIIHSHVFGTTKEFYARLFEPGEYTARILYDENKNGIWDPGNYFGTKRQPERVIPLSQTITVRPNWETLKDLILE